MSFLLLKSIHISSITGSYILFFLRGIWSMNDSSIMQKRWVKSVPHIVDTLLLISAIALAFTIHQYPFKDAWLTAKIIGLLVYIGMGFIALRNGISNKIRIFSWLTAQTVFGYIILVAIFHNPFPL